MKTIWVTTVGLFCSLMMMASSPVLANGGGCQINHLHGKGCSFNTGYTHKRTYTHSHAHGCKKNCHVRHHHSRTCTKSHKPKCGDPCPKKKCVYKKVRKPVCQSSCPDYRTGAHMRISRTAAYQEGFDAGCRTASTGHMYKNPKLHSYNAHYQLGWEAGVNQCHYRRTHINTEPAEFAVIPY